ncbi:MAG: hypothetical protein R3257_07785, partial [bacterium]|nr:hypothetical protein [bacterium]
FVMHAYKKDRIHVEHGNQFVIDNRYDPENYFLTENLPEPIINLPFGSFMVIHFLNEIKKERPYLDKVYPFSLYLRWAFIHDTKFFFKATFRLVLWFIKFVTVRNPARKINWLQAINILNQVSIHPKLQKEAKRLLMANKDLNIVIFGHTHQPLHRVFAPGKEYFNTGTWNERISIELGSLGRIRRLTFVQIDYDKDGIPQGVLKAWRGRQDVVEDLSY